MTQLSKRDIVIRHCGTGAAGAACRRLRMLMVGLMLCLGAAFNTAAQIASPHAIDIPRWFSNSLLDFKAEIPEAARDGKRVMVYFGQDGCPYCKALMKANFGPGAISDKTQRHFVAIAINIWGDLDVTWLDGERMTEKGLARKLKVQFTPTLLFFETDGTLVLRLNGYLPPERFTHVIDYVSQRRDRDQSLAEYMDAQLKEPALAPRGPRPYLMRQPDNLARAGRKRPLAVLFEAPSCKACAEMHDEAFSRASLRSQLQRFDVASLAPGKPERVVTPTGERLDARAWARDLKINLYPTMVFFDAEGREAFRFDGYLRPFHIESAFDYVASGAYRTQPEFQRFVQVRADRLREAGKPVDLWR